MTPSRELLAALEAEAQRYPLKQLTPLAQALSKSYNESSYDNLVIATEAQAVAYAAARMPATYTAIRTVLAEVSRLLPSSAPATQTDLGGGTGAAVWAAADTWSSLRRATVIDASPSATLIGRRLAGAAPIGSVDFQSRTIGAGEKLDAADLFTLGYFLAELSAPVATDLLSSVFATAELVVIVEPGTPAGYRRVLAARAAGIAAGFHVVAPCPHELACPLAADDWCHFGARLPRTPTQRRLKGGTVGFEDEKFSYVVLTRGAVTPATSRVIRRPAHGKGHVQLTLCESDGTAGVSTVGRSQPSYPVARKLSWGDAWEKR